MNRDVIVVTGMGVLTPIGDDCVSFWRAIERGEHGIGPVHRFETSAYDVSVAATLKGPYWDQRMGKNGPIDGLDGISEAAMIAAREAWNDAKLNTVAPDRIAVVSGTTAGGVWSRSQFEFAERTKTELRRLLIERSALGITAGAIADDLGITGSRWTVSTACTSSTNAIAHAFDLLRAGLADAVLVGGVDLLIEEMFAGFYSMSAMSAVPCAPFSQPVGMTVGEGAGYMVLERNRDALNRGARPRCAIHGYGLSLDAFHAISPDPTGSGIARAVASAISEAGLTPRDVGYFNAHGTGTDANDPAEWRAIQRVFGADAQSLPVSSSKSYFGHTLGAAGVLELIASALAFEHQSIPPTLSFTTPRGNGPPDPVAQSSPRRHKYTFGVSSNSAFGGANAAIVFGSPESAPAIATRTFEKALIYGLGVVAAHGTQGFFEALSAQKAFGKIGENSAKIPQFSFEAHVRGTDPRGFDDKARMLTVAASLALRDAEIRIGKALRDRIGLLIAAANPSWDSADEFWDTIRQRGFSRVSAGAFSRIVVNACAGAVSRALAVRGAVTVLAGGVGSTIANAILASEMLRTRSDTDMLIVGGVDELPSDDVVALRRPHYVRRGEFEGEGAVSMILGKRRDGDARALAEITGYGCSGPNRLSEAIRDALTMADCSPDAIERVFAQSECAIAIAAPRCDVTTVFGRSNVIDGLSIAGAVESMRVRANERPVRTALVASCDPVAGSFALILRAPEFRSVEGVTTNG